jgi:hypothetical protein
MSTQRRRKRPATQPKLLLCRKKQARACELRIQGWTLSAIAAELGYAGREGAAKAITAAISREVSEPAQQLIAFEAQRLDAIIRTHMPIACNTEKELNPTRSIERSESAKIVLKVMERRAKLLGLDAAMKTEISGPGGAPVPVTDLAKLFADPEAREAAKLLAKRLDAGPS